MASFQSRWIVLVEQIFEIETVKLTMKNHSGKYVVGLQGYIPLLLLLLFTVCSYLLIFLFSLTFLKFLSRYIVELF